MKDEIRKSMISTSIVFILVILYCVISILTKFNYLDLSYLVVVVFSFAVYLKKIIKLL